MHPIISSATEKTRQGRAISRSNPPAGPLMTAQITSGSTVPPVTMSRAQGFKRCGR